MHLSQLLSGIKHTLIGEGDIDVAMLAHHTNAVKNGCMFFCIKGSNIDSHKLIAKVVADGAIVLVVDHPCDIALTQVVVDDVRMCMALVAKSFYNNCIDRMKLITIVGTNGKTSTSYLLDAILTKAGYNTGIIGSNGVFISGKHYDSNLTTPDPIEMHSWFYQMYLNKVEYVIMELSAHAIHYNKHSGLYAELSIFTNFSQDHLDFFDNMQTYKMTKCNYFCQQYVNKAVVNADDSVGKEIIASNRIPTVSYSYDGLADVVASNYVESDGCDYTLDIGYTVNVNCKLSGIFNVYNTMSAIVACRTLGVPVELAVLAIQEVTSIDGRNQTVIRSDNVKIVVDFAHTPDGIVNILTYLRSITSGQLIVVFGCGGNRDKFKRPLMGQAVSKYADYIIITNDNPRYEQPLAIVGDIESGISVRYSVVLNRSQATEYALSIAKSGDTIAILGKGAEKYQEIKGKKYPYSDIDVIRKLLEKR